MKALLSLTELRDLIRPPAQRETLDFSLVEDGLPKGAITEISGSGKTEFALALLAEYPETKVAWVEETFSVYPFGFLQRNVQLGRVLFVESGRDTCWSVLQVLKAQVFSVVVVYSENMKLDELRKIQLATEKSNAVTLWLTGEPPPAEQAQRWPVSLQIKVAREEGYVQGQILRRRF